MNWDRVTHICLSELCHHHWFRKWLVASFMPSHYLNQCSDIVDWTPRNNLQWNLGRNSSIFIQESVFGNVVCKMASILSRPQCVKTLRPELNSYHVAATISYALSWKKCVPLWFKFRWILIPSGLLDKKSTLVQVMVLPEQATNYYVNQCWPRCLTPCGVSRPLWMNTLRPRQMVAILQTTF